MSNPFFHLKSMTAYGRGSTSFPYGSFTVEMQSVNRRHLELNVNLPRLLTRFEMLVRKKVGACVGRGMLNIYVNWNAQGKNPVAVTPNLSLAKGVKQAWELVAHELGMEASVDLSLLAKEKDMLLYEEEISEEKVFEEALGASVDEALAQLIAMKENEGQALSKDLHARANALLSMIEAFEEKSEGHAAEYRKRLQQKIDEVCSGEAENEERILREVALFAERIDITEEMVRFKSHIAQFHELLEKPLKEATETRGKILDFLIQELNREVNTIGSKAVDMEIKQQVVVAKGELEKMREQVQNIE